MISKEAILINLLKAIISFLYIPPTSVICLSSLITRKCYRKPKGQSRMDHTNVPSIIITGTGEQAHIY
jgi:hypothetical protein